MYEQRPCRELREAVPEIKAVAGILPAHDAQLRISLGTSTRIGLILNFNARRLDGIRRHVAEPRLDEALELRWPTVALSTFSVVK